MTSKIQPDSSFYGLGQNKQFFLHGVLHHKWAKCVAHELGEATSHAQTGFHTFLRGRDKTSKQKKQ